MPATNGTDEGVLRAWLDREIDHWIIAFAQMLDQSIEHLQQACFNDARQQLVSEGLEPEAIDRETLELYKEGLADLFRFVRASGAVVDGVAWSELKTGHRRALDDSGRAETLRDALDNALYEAESEPLGNHQLYRSWARSMMLFVFHHAAHGADEYPGPVADQREKIAWAYAALKDIEEHDVFHRMFDAYLTDPGVQPVIDAIIDHTAGDVIAFEETMLDQPRFDLMLNTALSWLIGAVDRE